MLHLCDLIHTLNSMQYLVLDKKGEFVCFLEQVSSLVRRWCEGLDIYVNVNVLGSKQEVCTIITQTGRALLNTFYSLQLSFHEKLTNQKKVCNVITQTNWTLLNTFLSRQPSFHEQKTNKK